MAFIDQNTKLAVEFLVEHDDDFKNAVRSMVKMSMSVLTDTLRNGTPEQKIATAKAFAPLFTKALATSSKEEDETSESEKVRRIITGLVPNE